MRTTFRLPRWFILTLLVTGLALGLTALSVDEVGALPQHETFCTFYYDAQKTQYAGSCYHSCLGNSCTGTRTSYFTCNDGRVCYDPTTCSEAPWCDPSLENCC